MIFYTEDKKKIIVADKPLGAGGEGAVYKIEPSSELLGADKLVVKLYESNGGNRAKLARLRATFADNIRNVSYPKELLFDTKGQIAGFIMSHFEGNSLYETVFIPKIVKKSGWDRIDLAQLTIRILERFIELHELGVMMADINPFNILVTKDRIPVFIDVDSYQIWGYPCQVCTLEYLSPRLAAEKADRGKLWREFEDEYYAITVLIFKIFLVGKNPYARNGAGSLEANLRSRDFVFPEGYDDTDNIPRGPWQRIWYNLPYNMRAAFYKTFREGIYLRPEKWIDIIRSYDEGLREGRYPKVIFPDGNHTELKKAILAIEPISVGKDRSLRQFSNALCDESSIKRNNYAFVKFGTNSIKCFEHQHGSKFNLIVIDTRHFECINADVTMDLQQLEGRLEENIKAWEEWRKYIGGIRPQITHFHAFASPLLRNLKNRKEVLDLLKQKLGISFGLYSISEEAHMLVNSTTSFRPSDMPIVIIDVNSTSMKIVHRKADIEKGGQYEYGDMGSKLLVNWFFATSHEDTRLIAKLNDHDSSVKSKIENIHIKGTNCLIFGYGIIQQVLKSKKNKPLVCTIKYLKQYRDALTEDLTCNRVLVKDLHDDLEYGIGTSFADKLELRLSLSIYISLIEKCKRDEITFMPFGTSEAYITEFLKSQ